MKIARLETYYFSWDFVTEPFDVETYLRDMLEIYDFDNCGDETSYWVVVDKEGGTKFYSCSHSWHWSNWGYEDNCAVNEFEINEITRADVEKDEYAKQALKFVV